MSRGDIDEALRWGVACGAAAAGRSGTAAPSFAEVAALAEQVEVRKIA